MSWPPSLSKADREMFTRFRIPSELVRAAHIERVKDRQSWNKWRLPTPRNGSYSGLVFPYTDRADTEVVSCRVRRDNPDVKKDGKPDGKYLSPEGTQYLYYPPGAAEKLRNPDTVIVLVEAEKSALAGTAWAERCDNHNVLFVGMGGCWGWSQDKAPLSDIDVCRNRVVRIMLDANAATNAEVQKARTALATALRKLDCDVLIADTPQIEGVNGPDDLLALEEGDRRMEDALAAARSAVVAPYSVDALAERVTERYNDQARHVREWGRWLAWNEQRWQEDVTGVVDHLVQEIWPPQQNLWAVSGSGSRPSV